MRHTVIDFMKKCGVISEDKNQMLVELGQGIKGDGLTEVRGSLDFIEVLNLYPSFVEGARNFKKRNSGRPTANPSPREVEYLVYLVEKLYLDNGRVYTRDDRRKLKEMLNRAVEGADFFDPVKSKHWIDMFSALDHTLHFFSPEGDERFAVFFTHYVSFYSKLNTKKIVPFYARWIKEIAAMYTVYLNGTFNEFEGIRDALQSALVDGMSNTPCERDLRYRTDAVRNYIMTNIFVAYEKDKKTVLCAIISGRTHPSSFTKAASLTAVTADITAFSRR